MKTFNNPTLTGSASHRTMTVANWLSASNSFLSELLGCNISQLSAVGVLFFGIFIFAALLLASDALQLYGWSAFFALLAINACIPLFNDFKEGGK